MIKTIAIALAALLMSGTAFAQNTYSTMPNGLGGYNTYYGGGRTSTTMPNGLGGYNTYYSGPGMNGQSTTTMPNGLGGYNT